MNLLTIRLKITLIVVALFCSIVASAQTSNPVFIGIQPNITVEPFYEEGEFDLNVFPFIFETPVGNRITLKLSPMVNYHVGGETQGISDVGIFSVLPVFFNRRESREDIPFGFYVGPVLGFGRNLINEHYTTTLAIEPGYMFETKKHFTISLGLQIGGSHFSYDSGPNRWVTHWGPKVAFGLWLY